VADRRLLDSTGLFAALPAEVIDELRSVTREVRVARGETLFAEGDEAHELYVVVDGRVAITTHAADGRPSTVAVLETGALFGELGLFDGHPRSADARALADTRVVAVRYDDVRRVLDTRPELLWIIVRLLAQRLRATDEALADAVFLDVPARTAKRLLELAGPRDEVVIPMTQEELAAVVGASRERVNKALAMFSRLGWIEPTGRGRYRIVSREDLERRAER
jgi:CRP-like cAMP-binding protein